MKNEFKLELNGGSSKEDLSKQVIPEKINEVIISNLKTGILNLEDANDEFKLDYRQNDDDSIDLSIHLPKGMKLTDDISSAFSENTEVRKSTIDEYLMALNILGKILETKSEVFKKRRNELRKLFDPDYKEEEPKESFEDESERYMLKISSIIDDIYKLGKITKTEYSKNFLLNLVINTFVMPPKNSPNEFVAKEHSINAGFIINNISDNDTKQVFLNYLISIAKDNAATNIMNTDNHSFPFSI